MGIRKVTLVGVLMEGMSLAAMIILALLDKTIPILISYIFFGGLVLVVVGSVATIASRVTRKPENNPKN